VSYLPLTDSVVEAVAAAIGDVHGMVGPYWTTEARAAITAATPLIRAQAFDEAADLLVNYAREFKNPSPLYGLLMSSSRSVRALADQPNTYKDTLETS
jgi:hypothetical protein